MDIFTEYENLMVEGAGCGPQTVDPKQYWAFTGSVPWRLENQDQNMEVGGVMMTNVSIVLIKCFPNNNS